MDQESQLRIIRRTYAKQITSAAGVTDPRIEDAFAAVRREDFLGPGPWPIARLGIGYVPTPSDDPAYLYTDVLVGIAPERNLNNGQPSLHAALIAAAAPQRDAHVVHIGAGVGYYTAILAKLGGRVTAIELDPDLAARAAANLALDARVRVIEGDGAIADFAAADVIYVNAGASRPAGLWLGRSRPADPAADRRRQLRFPDGTGFNGDAARRRVPDRAPRPGLPGPRRLAGGDLSLRRCPRRGIGTGARRGLRQ
jgi:protein-L-isoaspartate O-methyltransferase